MYTFFVITNKRWQLNVQVISSFLLQLDWYVAIKGQTNCDSQSGNDNRCSALPSGIIRFASIPCFPLKNGSFSTLPNAYSIRNWELYHSSLRWHRLSFEHLITMNLFVQIWAFHFFYAQFLHWKCFWLAIYGKGSLIKIHQNLQC